MRLASSFASLAAVVVMFASLAPLAAQNPVNDTCGTAMFVSDGVNGLFNNTGSDTSATVSCATSTGDVWFRYTATRSGSYVIKTCIPTGLSSGGDTVLSIHPNNCGAAIACDDNGCSPFSSITTTLTQGLTYRLRVASKVNMFPIVSFYLTIDPPAPANEECGSVGLPALQDGINPAAPLGLSGYWFSNVDAGTSQSIPTPCPSFNSVWFQYTATQTGPTTITTCTPAGFEPGSLADTVLSVYPNACTAAIICNDEYCGSRSSVTFDTTAGTVYRIEVGSNSIPVEGTFYITVKAPANDACADAMPLANGAITGSNANATSDPGTPAASCGINPGEDVWFTYTNPGACSRQVTLSLCPGDGGSAAFDSVLRVFSGADCGALTEVACNDDFCGGQSRLVFTAAPATTYRVSLSSDMNGPGGAFTLVTSYTSATTAQVAPGCTQGGGPGPTLSSNAPVLGATFTMTIAGAAPNAGGVLFFGNPLGGSTPLPGGCVFSLDPFSYGILFLITTNGSGGWSFSTPLPNDSALECASADLQALLFPAGGYQVTSCMRLVLGY